MFKAFSSFFFTTKISKAKVTKKLIVHVNTCFVFLWIAIRFWTNLASSFFALKYSNNGIILLLNFKSNFCANLTNTVLEKYIANILVIFVINFYLTEGSPCGTLLLFGSVFHHKLRLRGHRVTGRHISPWHAAHAKPLERRGMRQNTRPHPRCHLPAKSQSTARLNG